MLGVYFVAFKVLLKVKNSFFVVGSGIVYGWAEHMPRWGGNFAKKSEVMNTLFAPLIWMERKVRGPDRWYWDRTMPEPDWMKERWPKP